MINSICNEFFTPDGPTINPQYHGQQQQKQLNEEWIALCWRKSLIGHRISYVEYRDLVREVERAHNIKE